MDEKETFLKDIITERTAVPEFVIDKLLENLPQSIRDEKNILKFLGKVKKYIDAYNVEFVNIGKKVLSSNDCNELLSCCWDKVSKDDVFRSMLFEDDDECISKTLGIEPGTGTIGILDVFITNNEKARENMACFIYGYYMYDVAEIINDITGESLG